jgi:hypothetical protein
VNRPPPFGTEKARFPLVAREITIEKTEEQLHRDEPRDARESKRYGGKQTEARSHAPNNDPHLWQPEYRESDQDPAENPGSAQGGAKYNAMFSSRHNRRLSQINLSPGLLTKVAVLALHTTYDL